MLQVKLQKKDVRILIAIHPPPPKCFSVTGFEIFIFAGMCHTCNSNKQCIFPEILPFKIIMFSFSIRFVPLFLLCTVTLTSQISRFAASWNTVKLL